MRERITELRNRVRLPQGLAVNIACFVLGGITILHLDRTGAFDAVGTTANSGKEAVGATFDATGTRANDSLNGTKTFVADRLEDLSWVPYNASKAIRPIETPESES